ncbi:helix-turn-helix domain-containing protein [Nocardia cyriacigeorgica]|uniref:helix-turn-helix domain-containing protein n=1 Tax=Nocardia cyriacigeorgica TaxID=135487 RepID=UPI0018934CE8|nr:helix-turn-helix transcriptional regulator [Nocardia cyriacigeorgica]MBF6416967.1 helix-turn-helix domain-containing protein [Nocardia cyriacigeorgica]
MQEEEAIGARIARIRKERGMTQRALCARSHVSLSMLTKLETGKAAASTGTIGQLAQALGVDATRLTGPQDTPDQLHKLVPTIRRALATTDLIPDDIEPAPLTELRAQVAQLGEWRRATKYDKIGTVLPSLVDQLLVTARDEGEPAYALLADAYRAGNTLAHKLGYSDLSLTAMDRMEWAADRSGDPLLVATSHYLRAAALNRIGAGKQAMILLDRTMTDIEPLIGTDPNAAAVWTALHMRAGTIAATLGDEASSNTHLTEAAEVAERVGDRVVYETVVGPANVKLHAIAAAVDLVQPGKALKIAGSVEFPDGMAAERMAYYHLDTARAHLVARRPDEAIEELYAARALAPQHFRASGTVKAAIQTAAQQQRRASHGLRALANYAGLVD